jgi:hypothetical protein
VLFILRSIFGSKVGWSGLFLVLLKPLWNLFTAWQAVDFASSHIAPLFDFLDSFWGPFVLMLLGFLLIGKAVYDRWPETQGASTSESTNASISQPTSEGQQASTPGSKHMKTENKWLRKWFKRTSSKDRSRAQETSVDLKQHNDRVALKVLLTEAEEEGRQLCQNDPGFQEAQQWVTRTYNLINAATVGGIADYFLSDEGLEPPDDSLSDPQQTIQLRIRRIVEIKGHVDSLTLRHTFNRWHWMDN